MLSELDNLRRAIQWIVDQAEAQLGLRLIGALGTYLYRRLLTEGSQWATAIFQISGSEVATAAHGAALISASSLEFGQGRFTQARNYSLESLSIWQELGDGHWQAMALGSLAMALTQDAEAALQAAQEAEALFRQQARTWEAAELWQVGVALPALQGALRAGRATGERWLLAPKLFFLAGNAMLTADYATARECLVESITIMHEAGDIANELWPRNHLGLSQLGEGNIAGAAAIIGETMQSYRDLGLRSHLLMSLDSLGQVAEAQGEWEVAARIFGAVAEARSAHGISAGGVNGVLLARSEARVSAALGEQPFAAARSLGAALSLDEAYELGRAVVHAALG